MYAAQQLSTARTIARSANQKIRNKTGMDYTVMFLPAAANEKTPEKMMKVIATALDMPMESYTERCRLRGPVELRFIAAMLLRSNFPRITLHQIAALFGGKDHTSIISGLTRSYDLMRSGDEKFITKYYTAAQSVNVWLRTEE